MIVTAKEWLLKRLSTALVDVAEVLRAVLRVCCRLLALPLFLFHVGLSDISEIQQRPLSRRQRFDRRLLGERIAVFMQPLDR